MKIRPRRLRSTQAIRDLVSDVHLSPSALMQPIFIKEGLAAPTPIDGMYGVMQHTEDSFLEILDEAVAAGVKSVMLFAVPTRRDASGSEATNPDGILSRSVRKARAHIGDRLALVADLCLDEFTDHGHCGVLALDGSVDNDSTLEIYGEMATALAKAGADFLGASGMMDGQVGFVRGVLDDNGFTNTGILAYSAKFASGFYNPFRNAVESQLQGDRRGYQQDYRRAGESLLELELDIAEGADIVMVKPALAYLDILKSASEISSVPVAAYVVSGEYAMIEAAAAAGVLNRHAAILECLTAVRRAGANIICTYWATEIARKLKENL